MSFTNAQLAQKISDLIDYWSNFNEEYADWLGGAVDGGPSSDGQYPLTDYTGNETLVKSPAKLQDDVDNITTGATAQANAAAASAAAALTSETNAAASEAQATSDAAAAAASAAAAAVDEGLADSSATVATTQANLATDRAGYAQEWANAAEDVLVSVAAGGDNVDDYSALHHATKASASAAAAAVSETNAAASAAAAATFDPALFMKLDGTQAMTGTLQGVAATFSGAVTGSNLNVSNWDTAYGWGDHSTQNYAITTGDTFTGTLKAMNATLALEVGAGNSWSTYGPDQITFGYAGATDYRHGIGTRHNAGAQVGNAIDFFLWNQGTDLIGDLPTFTAMSIELDGSEIFTTLDAVGGGTVPVLGTVTQADTYLLLNRTNASNPVMHVTQAGAGPIALFGTGSIGGAPTANTFQINNDGGFTASGDSLINAGTNGRLEITGSGYVVNPTGLALGQYTSTIGYIQAPAGGRIAFWTDGTAEVAAIQDAGYMSFGGLSAGLTGVTGQYGSVETYGTVGGYNGLSLGGDFVFMANGANHCGIYDDINNAWIMLAYPNSYVNLYYAGSTKISTGSHGVTVNGNVRVSYDASNRSSYFENQHFVFPYGTWGNDVLHAAVSVRGGGYDSTVSSSTGYCIIEFPQGTTDDSTMMTMMIHGYNYSGTNGGADGGAWCIQVGGYYYGTELWHNTSARIVSGSPPFDRVLFGESETGDHKYILLGQSTTQWDYPKVWLTDLTTGHSTQHQWTSGDFAISFSASTPSGWAEDAGSSPIYLGGQIRWDGEGGSSAASKSAGGRITISTSAASGGQDGDIHFKY